MIHAYDELYIDSAQSILGHAFDFAVVTLGIDIDRFGKLFAVSDVSKQFAAGNPAYVAGRNGCEIARLVLEETGYVYEDAEDVMYPDRSPEFWAGWATAFYQWYCGCSFYDIISFRSFGEIRDMYEPFHEMDVMQFVERMTELSSATVTRLRLYRDRLSCSQSELSRGSGVALRQIQLFEQKQRDINKASADTLYKLSRTLNCRMEDLLE